MKTDQCNSTDGKSCCHGCRDARDILNAHSKIAVRISKGREAIACLIFLNSWREKINVISKDSNPKDATLIIDPECGGIEQQKIDGIEYWNPFSDWTKQDVTDYLLETRHANA